jgi:hypothetical protein
MKYQGYKNREEIFLLVENTFPYLAQRPVNALKEFTNDDLVMRSLSEGLQYYVDAKIPIDGVRYLHTELWNLSASGIAWVLPSLLRQAILSEQRFDTLHEFLIYDLEFDEDRIEDITYRYSQLNKEQIECLACVLEYFSEVHGQGIVLAMKALELLHGIKK